MQTKLGSLPVLFSDGDNICKPVRVLFLPNKADVAKLLHLFLYLFFSMSRGWS